MPRGVYDRSKFKKPVNTVVAQAVSQVTNETDEQILSRLEARFSTMDKMALAAFTGAVRAFIISGPAGLGKSYGVTKIAEAMKEQGNQVEFIKGFVRPTGLYKALYENRHKHCVLVFDDADSIFFDDISMNLLKTACDMTRQRMINWRAETNMKDEGGDSLPTQFEFEGTIIFITNIDFDREIKKASKLAPHFEAMVSRSMYLDLGMKTTRDYLVRIKQVVNGGMLADMGLTQEQSNTIVSFIEANLNDLRELSLRMVVKLATLMLMDEHEWEMTARCVCFKPKA